MTEEELNAKAAMFAKENLAFMPEKAGGELFLSQNVVDMLRKTVEGYSYIGYKTGYKEALQKQPALSHWITYDFNKLETRPLEYGKYFVCRKDGKVHWEIWNGSGWAYNEKSIIYWAHVVPPVS